MALLSFNDVGIIGLSAGIPKNIIKNLDYTEHFNKKDVKKIVDKTGIIERRFADANTCASDLCYFAAEKLITDLGLDKTEIDALIFISQTPDYRMPATSVILQNRLKLGKHVLAFDMNLGCSAFVYGLSVAFSLCQNEKIKKVLVLDGETRSRVYHPKDRNTAFLFGDGGVAALIEKNQKFGKSYFSLNSDGAREDLIKVKAGGYRYPSTPETLKEFVADEYGNIRTEEHGYMNGADVFNFVLAEIPKDIKKTFEFAGVEKSDIDYFVFHQANSFMNNYLGKKLKLEPKKIPTSIAKFGNTSSVSIPITIVSQLQNKLNSKKKLLLCGFGVGMSWATSILNLEDCFISDIVEV